MSRLWYYMDEYWEEVGDPRVNDWMFISGGIWRILLIMITYLTITRIFLPKYMKNREPFELRNVMLVYNILMVFINTIGFCFAIQSIDFGRIFLNFEFPSRDDRSHKSLWLLTLGWLFLLSRFADLADTFFFVLRKKESQITGLHLYHHTIVPLITWVSFKYNALVPINRMFALINTAIHTLMYGYYALAACGPNVQKYLWWKRYLTQLQILQFVICGTYGVILYCKQINYPMDWFYFVVGQNPIFFFLFYNFYAQSYKNSKHSPKSKIT